MGLWFTEGFSWSTDRLDYLGKWENEPALNPTAGGGRFYGNSMPAQTLKVNADDPGTTNSIVVGFAAKRTGTGTFDIVQFLDDTSQMLAIELRTDGKLYAMEGLNEVASSTVGMQNNGQWYYWEVKVLLKSTAVGSVAFQLDGVAAGSTGSIQTIDAGTSCTIVQFQAFGTDSKFDDIYVGDTSGAFDFLGDVTIETIFPNADNGTPDFTRSAGANNYENVDETNPDADTTYNESNTSAHRDTFDFPAISALSADTVHAAAVTIMAKKVDPTSTDLKAVTISGATTDVGTALGVGSSGYASFQYVWEQDPNVTAAWTKTTIEAAKFGYERV
jgi:hypothetical protein